MRRNVLWYADPHGAGEIAQLIRAGLKGRKGNAAVREGIAMVQTRIRTGTLRILEGTCPNLLAEAGLYRWDDTADDNRSEQPKDGCDHGCDAVRCWIFGEDKGGRDWPIARDVPPLDGQPAPPKKPPQKWDAEADRFPAHDPAAHLVCPA